MLDRYDIEHELGTGARGAVYRGREKYTGERVAIKLTPLGASHVGTLSGRAAHNVGHLNHPHLVRVRESGHVGQLAYAVLDLAEGVDLSQHAASGCLLPARTVLSAMSRIACALHFLHQHGRFHGDVKPANIVFDRQRESVKLIDFDAESNSIPLGSLAYMAPERLKGAPNSAASDEFSFAVTLYELLCGQLPFGRASLPELVWRTAHDCPAQIDRHRPELPRSVVVAIEKALSKIPGHRFGSMQAFSDALIREHSINARCSLNADVLHRRGAAHD